ncbi:cellulase [Stachybotrys elegans]|uniref:Glucanase n=1 Tax=Stachybotrys elegans TaxID=80388 RepID=A0A8K0WKK2_9HYPO|nr:cellulase [Stachybotrys elegans]
MAPSLPVVASTLLGFALAQHPGSTPEVHPRLTTYKCTIAGGCTPQNSAIVLDGLAHPVYQVDAPEYNCGDWGNAPNATACPDAETCQANCVMDGISDYSAFGVTTDGASLHLRQLTDAGDLVTPRVYLLTEDEQSYEMLYLTGQEFTFDVDVTQLPCGMNGALYLSEMLEDGGKSELNTGGAYYGTGYCDAQCYTTPFINGEPNLEGYGSCCGELDIWEANSRSTLLAPHPCNITHLYKCEGVECEWEGVCDEWGCGMNSYQNGSPDFYGLDYTVDTSKPFTVVTQFPADEDGILREYHRIYLQDGKIIKNVAHSLETLPNHNYMDDEYCLATGGAERYLDLGGTAAMGAAMSRGMVLAMSIWWAEGDYMQWLDGNERGPCNATEGAPSNIRLIQPDPAVTFSNIKWGEIGSTFQGNCTVKPKLRRL